MNRYFIGLLFIALIHQFTLAQTTWQVGPNKTYTKPSQVINLVKDGDIVEIDAGEYIGDVGAWYANDITIRGIGGKAHLRAAGNYSQGKAIWVIIGNDYTLENIEFSECKVPDHNGAGIRHEGANLTIRNCYFHDNEEGILTISTNLDSDVLVEFSEFARNSHPNGRAHNIYINEINRFTMRYNYFHGAIEGHNVKSRANENYILYNRIMDEQDGGASYQIDLPRGGNAYIVGNIIQQGKNAPNFHVLAYAAEVNNGTAQASNNCFIYNNTIVNERGNGFFLKVFDRIDSNVKFFNNLLVGEGDIVAGPAIIENNRHFIDREAAGLVDIENYDYHLKATSPMIDRGIVPTAQEATIMPTHHYIHPQKEESRLSNGTLDIGAYEFGAGMSMELNPTIIAEGTTEICSGENKGLMVDQGYASYNWSTGETAPSILVNAVGTYSVTVSDSQNNSGSATIIINEKANCSVSEMPDWNIVSTSTGTNHTIIIPSELESNINGKALQNGDWIGFFFQDNGIDKCAGFGQWDNTVNASFPVYGDDSNSADLKEGFTIGERFNIKVWAAAEGKEYAVDYTFAPADNIITHENTYANNGISRIESLYLNAEHTTLNPEIAVIGASSICPGETTRIDAGTGYASYNWNKGETTHSILVTAPGTYNVTVSDAKGNTGSDDIIIIPKEDCEVISNETEEVIFNLGRVETGGEAETLLPVRAENFDKIGGFQFSLKVDHLANDFQLMGIEEAEITGIQYHIEAGGKTINIAWFNEEGVSLADEAILFYLKVNVAIRITECFELVEDMDAISVEVVQYQEGIYYLVPYQINAGAICPLSDFEVSGQIFTENGMPVSKVIVYHNETDSVTTNSLGNYFFNKIPGGQVNKIRPAKESFPLEGISTLDLVLILAHVVGEKALNSPYKMIAADVNLSGSISVLDVTILSSLIINRIQAFPAGQTWRFIPANYEFQDASNPFNESFPEYLTIDMISAPMTDANFIGIKLGDVTQSSNGRAQQAKDILEFSTASKPTAVTNEYLWSVTTENVEKLMSWQMELNFSPQEVEVMEVVPGEILDIGDFQLNQQLLKKGKIPLIWFHTAVVAMDKGTTLFTIRYKRKNTAKARPFSLGQTSLLSEVVKENYEEHTIRLIPRNELSEVAFGHSEDSKITAFPNPFNAQLQLLTQLNESAEIQLIIRDINGRKIGQAQKQFSAGKQYWQLQPAWFKHAGVYFLELMGDNYVHTIKVVRF